MSLLTAVSAVFCLTMITLAIGLPACTFLAGRTDKVFDTIRVGDTKESVISKMGTPSRIHPRDQCTGACVHRLWYDSPCLDVWLVDLDKNNKVIEKDREFSP
jgi:hypothetical protein